MQSKISRLSKWILSSATAALLLTGCSSDDGGPTLPDTGTDNDTLTNTEPPAYENGILVLNEGNFGAGNASVSFIPDDLSEVQNDIFGAVNEVDAWGDTAQSMAFNDSLAYIVINGSQKIEVVDRYTFESVATIGGADEADFLNPRYMAIANGKGYVTNWGDGTDAEDDFVAVVNLENNTVESKIPVPEGPERLLVSGNTLYIALTGGFNFNNAVLVIDATSNTVTGSITVADAPNSMQLGADGNLWVLSGGKPAYTNEETAGQLDKIDTSNNEVTATFAFGATEHPGYLSYENGSFYYTLADSVLKMDEAATELPFEAEIAGVNFYDMTVNQGKLYGTDAKDFASNGSLEIYDLSNNSVIDSKATGINPGAVYFNGSAGQ